MKEIAAMWHGKAPNTVNLPPSSKPELKELAKYLHVAFLAVEGNCYDLEEEENEGNEADEYEQNLAAWNAQKDKLLRYLTDFNCRDELKALLEDKSNEGCIKELWFLSTRYGIEYVTLGYCAIWFQHEHSSL